MGREREKIYACHRTCMVVRRQLTGVSLLPLCESLGFELISPSLGFVANTPQPLSQPAVLYLIITITMVIIFIVVIPLITTETGPLTDLNSLFHFGWLAHKHLEFPFTVAPEMGVHACTTILCFYGVSRGTEPRFSCLCRSHFTG